MRIVAALVTALVLATTGCGKKPAPQSPAPGNAAPANAAPAPEAPMAEPSSSTEKKKGGAATEDPCQGGQ